MNHSESPPILFLIFNRPDKALRVFKRIREAKPKKLFIAADGPRENKPEETGLCEQTRETILSLIDWPCEVETLFRKDNLGCKQAISSAINWFFEHVEEGIILEDDCLPDLTFFQYCSELLDHYRDHKQVMMISGNCHLPTRYAIKTSYYFSKFAYIWGWATWKHAWSQMDITMTRWNSDNNSTIIPSHLSSRHKKLWVSIFDANNDKGSSWAFIWQYSIWCQGGVSINPSTNLVSHIDTTGTHMKPYDPLIGNPENQIEFPLEHPSGIHPNLQADKQAEKRARRSILKNIQLILLYLARLPFDKHTPVIQGLRQLYVSIASEIRHQIQR